MASEAQIRANRENAARSTGPRTEEGRMAVRHNALKHGLLAQAVVLHDENEAEFERLSECLHEELQPQGELESELVDRIAISAWRLRRVLRIENGILTEKVYRQLATRAKAEVERQERLEDVDAHIRRLDEEDGRWVETEEDVAAREEEERQLAEQEAAETESALTLAERRAKEVKAVLDSPDVLVGIAFLKDASGAGALSKLSRYETTLERALYRALAELRVAQALRKAGPAPQELSAV